MIKNIIKKNKLKIIFTSFVLFYSSFSLAACPPPVYLNFNYTPILPAATPCSDQKVVNEFSGAASASFTSLNANIASSSRDVIDAFQKSSKAEIKSYSVNSGELIKILNQLSGTSVANDISRGQLVHEAKMDYMLELQDTKMKAEQSPIGINTTAEELIFIADFFKTQNEYSIKEYIKIMKITMDDKDKKIPVKIKSAKGTCEDDPDNPSLCAVLKTITPGKTTEILFDECSRSKRSLIASIKQQKAVTKVSSTMQKSQSEAIEVVNTTQASSQMLIKQRKISCSPEEFHSKVCSADLSNRQYSKAIVRNEVINNGNISASNLFNPPMVGSIDGSFEGISEADQKIAAQSNVIFEGNETKDSAPPLLNTYKNSNQYLAAIDMVDNILNEAAVANQPLSERKNLKNAEFQAGYLSRMASLSLSKFSLQNSVNDRLGSNIQNIDEYDRENPVKELYNGAGTLDQLIFDIETDYKNIGGDKTEELYEKNEKALAIMMLEAQLKQNKLVLAQIIRNERIELLLATILANEYNSPSYTSLLNNLRGR